VRLPSQRVQIVPAVSLRLNCCRESRLSDSTLTPASVFNHKSDRRTGRFELLTFFNVLAGATVVRYWSLFRVDRAGGTRRIGFPDGGGAKFAVRGGRTQSSFVYAGLMYARVLSCRVFLDIIELHCVIWRPRLSSVALLESYH